MTDESKPIMKQMVSSTDLTKTIDEIRTRFSADEMISSADLDKSKANSKKK